MKVILMTLMFILTCLYPVFSQEFDPNQQFSQKVDPNQQFREYFDKGNILFQEGKLDEAGKEYVECVKLNKAFADVWFNLALILHTRLDLDGAIDAYKMYLSVDPKAKDAKIVAAIILTLEGEKLYKRQRYDDALVKFREAISIRPFPYAYFGLGLVYDKFEDRNLAIKAYEKAVKLMPDYGEAHFNLAVHYEADGNYKKAIKHYKEYLRINPHAQDASQVKEWIQQLK